MYTNHTTDEQQLLNDWHEATAAALSSEGAAPGPRYRLSDEAADARYASGPQRIELTYLCNSHRITRAERTAMLLAINQLSAGYAARAIARLRRAVDLRLDGPQGPRPGAPAMARRGDAVYYPLAA